MVCIDLGNLGTDAKVTLACYGERVALWIGGSEYTPDQSVALIVLCRIAEALDTDTSLDLRRWIDAGTALGARVEDERVHLYRETRGLTFSIAYVAKSDIGGAAALIEKARERALELAQWRKDAIPVQRPNPLTVQLGWENLIH
jgi:hypothetical protein